MLQNKDLFMDKFKNLSPKQNIELVIFCLKNCLYFLKKIDLDVVYDFCKLLKNKPLLKKDLLEFIIIKCKENVKLKTLLYDFTEALFDNPDKTKNLVYDTISNDKLYSFDIFQNMTKNPQFLDKERFNFLSKDSRFEEFCALTDAEKVYACVNQILYHSCIYYNSSVLENTFLFTKSFFGTADSIFKIDKFKAKPKIMSYGYDTYYSIDENLNILNNKGQVVFVNINKSIKECILVLHCLLINNYINHFSQSQSHNTKKLDTSLESIISRYKVLYINNPYNKPLYNIINEILG